MHTENITCRAFDEASEYEYRNFTFVGVPPFGHFLRLRRDETTVAFVFEITRVEHLCRNLELPRLWVYASRAGKLIASLKSIAHTIMSSLCAGSMPDVPLRNGQCERGA